MSYNFHSLIILLALLVSSCCGSGDDGDVTKYSRFILVNSASGETYFTINGPFLGEEIKVYEEDNTTELRVLEPTFDGRISFEKDESYGEFKDNEVLRNYFIHLPDNDIDTLTTSYILSSDRCNSRIETYNYAIFNDSLYESNTITFFK